MRKQNLNLKSKIKTKRRPNSKSNNRTNQPSNIIKISNSEKNYINTELNNSKSIKNDKRVENENDLQNLSRINSEESELKEYLKLEDENINYSESNNYKKPIKNKFFDKKFKEDQISEKDLSVEGKREIYYSISSFPLNTLEKHKYEREIKNINFTGMFPLQSDIKINSEYERHVKDSIIYEKRDKNLQRIYKVPKIENFNKVREPIILKDKSRENINNYQKLNKLNNQKILLLNKYSMKLNSEWVPYFDKNGVVYFYNRISGDTSFNFPKIFNHKMNRYENLLYF